MKDQLAQRIQAFMKQYDPAEFGEEEANGGETYAAAFSASLAEQLLTSPMNFKFELTQLVNISVSDEWGEVKGRAEYSTSENGYYVHYKAADGRAVSAWFDESSLHAVEDENHPGCAVYAGRELPKGAVVEE